MHFLNTPHPPIAQADGHPLPQGERDSCSPANGFLCDKKNTANTIWTTSPLVGEVARRAGEGYFKILQTLKPWPRLIQRSLIIILPLTLAGCIGIYEGGFECPAGTGVGCKSISDVNAMVNQCSVSSIQCSECAITELKTTTPPSSSERLEIWYSPHFRGRSGATNEVSPTLMGA